MFVVVVEPNEFVASVEQARPAESRALSSLEDLLAMCADDGTRAALAEAVGRWTALGYRRRLGPNHVVLEAPGPAASGIRTVVALYADGRVQVPFASYAGMNSGIEVAELTTAEFRSAADALFGFNGSERQARTVAGWLVPERVSQLMEFAVRVAAAYALAQAL